MSLTQSHYDKPISHSQYQTRYVIAKEKKVYSPSIKLLDIKANPDQDCYYPVLTGVYSLIKKLQVSLNSIPVDVWDAQQTLPYLIAEAGDNEQQKGIIRELYGTGNNVSYDVLLGKFFLDRPLVDQDGTTSLKLNVLSDLLNSIGVVNDEIEIIITWDTDVTKCVCSKDSTVPVTSISIDPPYLTYETFNDEREQLKEFMFRRWTEDQLYVPIATAGVLQTTQMRSNAFNQKNLGRILMSNVPLTINAGTPADDAKNLYSLFSKYMSIPMIQESLNVAKNGAQVLTMRNIDNPSLKLALTHDTFGKASFVSGAQMHLQVPTLTELTEKFGVSNLQVLNGFASFGSVEISDNVTKDLQFSMQRLGSADYTTLNEAMLLIVDAEVNCMYSNGSVSYVL